MTVHSYVVPESLRFTYTLCNKEYKKIQAENSFHAGQVSPSFFKILILDPLNKKKVFNMPSWDFLCRSSQSAKWN